MYPVESSRSIDETLTRPVFRGGHTLSFWVADVTTGEGHEFWRNPLDDPAFASIDAIQWAGDNVVFRAERNNWNHYYSVPISGMTPTPVELTPGEGVAEQMGFSRDGGLLYYTSNVGD